MIAFVDCTSCCRMARQPACCIGTSCWAHQASTCRLHLRHSTPKRLVKHAAHGDKSERSSGWSLPWPFKPPVADGFESEYEIVYVTDHGTDDAEQQQHEQATPQIAEGEQLLGDRQQQQQQPTAVAAQVPDADAAQSRVDALGSRAAPLDKADYKAPEPTATATAAPPDQGNTSSPVPQSQVSIPSNSITPTPIQVSPAAFTLSHFLESSAGGWVIAAALLLAVREGRSRADADRLDVRVLQARQENSRVQSRELREKRARYLQQQQNIKEAQAAKRLSDAARQAEADRQQAAQRAAEYEKVALEELEALRARRAAAKKAFDESAGRLDAELRERTSRELALREEELARKQQQQEQQRAAAAAEAARLAAEAAAAAAAAETAAREAAERRKQERLRARQESTRLQVQLTGEVIAAPVATTTTSSSRQLSVMIQLYPDSSSSSSSEVGPIASISREYDSADAAVDGATRLAAAAARQVVQHYAAALQQPPPPPSAATAAAAAAAATATTAAAAVLQQQIERQQLTRISQPGLQITPPNQTNQISAAAAAAAAGSSSSSSGISQADLELWRMLLFLRVESCARLAVCQVAPLAGGDELKQDFKVFQRYSTLPPQHSSSLQQQLAAAADLIGQSNMLDALQILTDVIEWQLEDFVAVKSSSDVDLGSSSSNSSSSSSSSNDTSSDLKVLLHRAVDAAAASSNSSSPVAVYLVPACVFAVLLNYHDPETIQHWQQHSSSSSSSSSSRPDSPDGDQAGSSSSSTPMDTAVDEELVDKLDSSSSSSSSRRSIVGSSDSALQRFVKFQLEDITRQVPQDSLAPLAAALQVVLGRGHPVAVAMAILAERNTSLATRQAREMRRQQKQLAKATQLLQGSSGVIGPGGLDPQGARLRQDLVPVPERTWALRNVANNMLRTAAPDSAAAEEALGMLRQASELAAQHYGKTHPGQLSALLDYISALVILPNRTHQAAAAVEDACSIVSAVGDRYRQQQDLLSLVLLYESAQAELDVPGILGRDNTAMVRLQRQAADAFSVLDTPQANLVMSKRKIPPGSPSTALRQLARDCTEQLGVYTSSRKRVTRLGQWNKGLQLTPLR